MRRTISVLVAWQTFASQVDEMGETVREESTLQALVGRNRGQIEALEHAKQDERSCSDVRHVGAVVCSA